MITVTLYTRHNHEASQQAITDLETLQEKIPFRLVEIPLEDNTTLMENYGAQAPVVVVGPYKLYSPFSMQDLQVTIGAAADRVRHLEQVGDEAYQARVERGQRLTGSDRFSYWLSNHYMLLFNLVVFMYVGLPFLAPVLMKAGAEGPAAVVYKIYSPLCHQLAYRSWFLFGEQPAYPRGLAGITGWQTFQQVTGLNDLDILAARELIGDSKMGYKVALCERDVAIYGSILLFGIIFALTGRRLKSLPWYIWVFVGIIPIGLDGISQLPSLLDVSWLSSLPVRESTPLLRTITGFLFGFTTAWFGYPYVEDGMRDTRILLTRKIAIIKSNRIEDRI